MSKRVKKVVPARIPPPPLTKKQKKEEEEEDVEEEEEEEEEEDEEEESVTEVSTERKQNSDEVLSQIVAQGEAEEDVDLSNLDPQEYDIGVAAIDRETEDIDPSGEAPDMIVPRRRKTKKRKRKNNAAATKKVKPVEYEEDNDEDQDNLSDEVNNDYDENTAGGDILPEGEEDDEMDPVDDENEDQEEEDAVSGDTALLLKLLDRWEEAVAKSRSSEELCQLLKEIVGFARKSQQSMLTFFNEEFTLLKPHTADLMKGRYAKVAARFLRPSVEPVRRSSSSLSFPSSSSFSSSSSSRITTTDIVSKASKYSTAIKKKRRE